MATNGRGVLPTRTMSPMEIALLCMQTKELGDFILARSDGSNAQREFDQPLLVVVDFDLVHRKEHDSRCRAGAFVAIDERMVLHDVVQVRCSHFKRKRMR